MVPFTFFIFILSTCIILKILTTILLKISSPKSHHLLPPGPPKLPIIGNLHQLAFNKTLPHQQLHELARVYGPIMHLQLGEVSTMVVSSADVAKEVMKTHDSNFVNRPKLMMGREVYYNYSDIALAPYGEYWRQVRKIATLELFTAKRVHSFRPIREEEAANLVNSIASAAADGDGSLVNLSAKIFGFTFDLISRIVFSKRGKDQEAFRALVTLLVTSSSGFAIADLYPSIKLFYAIDRVRAKIKYIVEESNRLLDTIIHDHNSNQRQGNEGEDLVDVLLKFHRDDPDPTQFSLTVENIKAIILEIFSAGAETSSTIVEWVMAELLKNPKAMEKAQKEVRQLYQEKGIVDESRLHELKFLKLVLKETLRLHPPFPLVVPRESIEKCEIQGYDIPSKTRVMVNAWAIHRDPKYWMEPDMFKPERFEDVSIDFKGNDFELIPFGAGRRMCPALALGVANVELLLVVLLYNFNWKLPHGIKPEDLDMDGLFGIAARRKNELFVLPIPYSSS